MVVDRRALLESLVKMSAPLAEIRNQLRAFSWDSEEELVVLTAKQMKSVLRAYLDERLTADAVREWAEVIEGRDDIGFESSQKDALLQVIYELANPVLCGKLNRTNATQFLSYLDSKDRQR